MDAWDKHYGFHFGALLPAGRFQQRFCDALCRMKPEELPHWLRQGANPNARIGVDSALGIAARSPFTDVELLRQLVAAGAEVNPGSLYPPLLKAAHSGDDAKVETLIDLGADVAVVDRRYERSVISELASWAPPHIIRKALELGAPAEFGYPLHSAIWANQLEVVCLLLQFGVSKEKQLRGKTPLEFAQTMLVTSRRPPNTSNEVLEATIALLNVGQ